MSHRLPAGKSCIGSFMTHDDKSAMTHGGPNYCNMTTIIQSTIPMCNPYFVDGFQSGDYYNYNYSHKNHDETVTYKIVDELDFYNDPLYENEILYDKQFFRILVTYVGI